LEKRAGKYIPNQETMFHGRMGEAIPKWSRLQGGEWFQAQLAAGYTVSNAHKEIATSLIEMGDVAAPVIKKVIRRKKVAVPSAESSQSPKPEPVVAPATTKKREPKRVVKAAASVAPSAEPSPEPSPEPSAEPMPPQVTMLHTTSGFMTRDEVKPKRTKKTVAIAPPSEEITEIVPITIDEVKAATKPKRAVKKVIKPKQNVIGVVVAEADDTQITKIQVSQKEIGGLSVYVSEAKDKVYDLSYKYLGRWNRKEGRVDATYPDSDAEPF
jgi:hypothetical protein